MVLKNGILCCQTPMNDPCLQKHLPSFPNEAGLTFLENPRDLMVTSLQEGPCIVPPTMNRADVSSVEYCRNDGVWLLRLGHKRYCTFYFALLDLGKARCHVVRTLKQHHREAHIVGNWDLQPTTRTNLPGIWVHHLESRSFNLIKLSDNCGFSWHLDTNLMREIIPDPPSYTIFRFLTYRTYVKCLSFSVAKFWVVTQ